jgi:hypothetical protein
MSFGYFCSTVFFLYTIPKNVEVYRLLGSTYFNSHPLSCYKIFKIFIFLGYLITICKQSVHKFPTGKYLSHAFPTGNDL